MWRSTMARHNGPWIIKHTTEPYRNSFLAVSHDRSLLDRPCAASARPSVVSYHAVYDAWSSGTHARAARRNGLTMIEAPGSSFSGDEFENVSAAIAQGVPLEVALNLIMQRTCDL